MQLKRLFKRAYYSLGLLAVYGQNYADGLIPTSSSDQTQSGSDFAQTVIKIFNKDIIPIFEVVGAIGILWISLSALWNGLKEAQETKKWDPLKNAIIKAVLVIVIGGAILYLFSQIPAHDQIGG